MGSESEAGGRAAGERHEEGESREDKVAGGDPGGRWGEWGRKAEDQVEGIILRLGTGR